MVVPIRIWREGLASPELAHTLDADESGVRIGGYHGTMNLVEVVTVQYQHRRARHEVIWRGWPGTRQGTQAGLRCLEPEKNLWGVVFAKGRSEVHINHSTLKSTAPA